MSIMSQTTLEKSHIEGKPQRNEIKLRKTSDKGVIHCVTLKPADNQTPYTLVGSSESKKSC